MNEKAIGYLLLVIGIPIILAAGLSGLLVFSGQTEPIKPFSATMVVFDSLPAVVPSALIINFANLIAHLLLMGFLAGIGYKLSALGVLLLRPMSVKVLDKDQINIFKS